MQTYYTDLVAKYYSLSQPWYDSMFRDFFFEGATEEEIKKFLFDSNAYANEEYTALKNRNDEIELEFDEEACREIARMAKEQNTGARGLRAIMEGFLQKIMFEIPDRRDVKKVVITKEVVSDGAEPKLVLRKQKAAPKEKKQAE